MPVFRCKSMAQRVLYAAMIQLYVILGCAGSGRREVLADLLDNGLQGCVVLLAASEAEAPSDSRLHAKARVLRWEMDGDSMRLPQFPEGADCAALICDGRADPAVQMEHLAAWLKGNSEVELARIITVLHSHLLYEKPHAKLWFDACIHFSDVVLFHKREEVPNKWFSDLQQRFTKACYPCIFEFVKGGRVKNPAQILFPEALRMSLAFEIQEDAPVLDSADLLAEDFDLGDEADEDLEEDAGEDEILDNEPQVDPYFERDMSGRRKIHLPDIRDYLNG